MGFHNPLVSLASCTTSAMSSSRPWPSLAVQATTGTLRSWESFLVSMVTPLRRTSSIMFRPSTRGAPISMNCTARYRLRSRAVASTMLMTTSGCSSTMTFLATTSSME